MNAAAQAALLGRLGSETFAALPQQTFANPLGIDVRLLWTTPEGWLAGPSPNGTWKPGYPGQLIPKSSSIMIQGLPLGPANFVVVEAHSGGFIGVVGPVAPGMGPVGFDPTQMIAPGDAGPIPEPSPFGRLIPLDTPRVVVGYGEWTIGLIKAHIVREQCWRRLPDSYTLAPKETRTMSRTVTSGMERTSSVTSSIEASLGLGASGGMGPISATVSAALSASSTHTQSVVFDTHETTFVSETLTNPADHAVMYLRWQLTDIVTVHANGYLGASMVTVNEPCVLRGPYALNYAGELDDMQPLEPPVVIVGG